MGYLKLWEETRASSRVNMGMAVNHSWFLMDVRPPFLLPETLRDSSQVVAGESGCNWIGGRNTSICFLLQQQSCGLYRFSRGVRPHLVLRYGALFGLKFKVGCQAPF